MIDGAEALEFEALSDEELTCHLVEIWRAIPAVIEPELLET